MQVESYLKRYQPVIYRTFVNSKKQGKLSHAYLISGAPGTPLLEVAKYLAKSILCDDPSPLACNNCITCLRVDDNNYTDLNIYDGSLSTIKKQQVVDIEIKFQKKAFESKGIMIYILHLVENMTVEAVNSILKFLEEPETEVYAFLTTNNESIILPTIVSRCQTLRLKLVNRNQIIEEAIENGVAQSDAELLSYFYNDVDLIEQLLQDEERKDEYYFAKECFEGLFNALLNSDDREILYYTQRNIIPRIETKESCRFFIDILTQGFENILNIQNHNDFVLKSYATILEQLAIKMHNVDRILTDTLKDRTALNTNVNVSLLLDHLVIQMAKELK